MRQANPIGMGLVALLLGGALAVRGIAPRAIAAPEQQGDEVAVAEPMQLLRAGGTERVAELEALVAVELRNEFETTRLDLIELDGCPTLTDWLRSRRGLAFEQTAAALSRDSRVDALASLSLLFHVARSTSWSPGMFGSSEGAERLAGLFRRWLEDRAEEAAEDPLLYEPALAAALVYGHVMHLAFEGNLFGDSTASRDRGRAFLRRLAGTEGGPRTRLGIALGARYPGALARLERDGSLAGFTEECELVFPKLDGECGE